MPITVVCSAPVRYDSEQKKYIACGRKLKVADKLAGRRVKCPDCGGAVEVPSGKTPTANASSSATADKTDQSTDDDWLTLEADDAIVTPQESPPKKKSSKEKRAKQTSAAKKFPRSGEPTESTSQSEAPQSATSPTRASPFDSSRQSAPPSEMKPCPGCGVDMPLHGVLCENCGYHNLLDRRFEKLGDTEAEVLVTGFRRWLGKRLTSGESADTMISLAPWCLAAFVLAVSILFFLMLRWPGLAIAVTPWLVLFGGGWLGFWPRNPWEWVLAWGRKFGWRNWTPALPKVKMLDLRKADINDAALIARDDLAGFGAIDLEGTPITDAGLAHLIEYRNLGFIILKKTKVSEDGLYQTEQRMPNSWFWY